MLGKNMLNKSVDVLHVLAIPVGVAGEILDSWGEMCEKLRIKGKDKKQLARKMSLAAMVGSHYVYNQFTMRWHL